MPRTARASTSTASAKPRESRQRGRQADVVPSARVRSTTYSESGDVTSVEPAYDIYALSRTPSPMPHTRNSRSKRQPTKATSEIVPSRLETVPFATSPIKPEPKPCSTKNSGSFEALDAVNELYRQLKDSLLETQVLKKENQTLCDQVAETNARLEKAEAEWKGEQDKYAKQRKKWEMEGQKELQEARRQLVRVTEVLSMFGNAAGGLLPLLDVLVSDGGTEDDDAAEELKAILEVHRRGASHSK